MTTPRWLSCAAGLVVFVSSATLAQEVRRAQPVNEPPMARPVPFDEAAPTARPKPIAPTAEDAEALGEAQATPGETESADRRQLDYANALFGRKLYDLAAPEYEKFLGAYPEAADRGSAYFYLGECYRALNRTAAAKSSFQSVLDQFGESEFAGPGSLWRRRNSLHAKRLRWRAGAISSRRRENERVFTCGLGSIFRSALSRKSESERRGARRLSTGD